MGKHPSACCCRRLAPQATFPTLWPPGLYIPVLPPSWLQNCQPRSLPEHIFEALQTDVIVRSHCCNCDFVIFGNFVEVLFPRLRCWRNRPWWCLNVRNLGVLKHATLPILFIDLRWFVQYVNSRENSSVGPTTYHVHYGIMKYFLNCLGETMHRKMETFSSSSSS
jgi:hypothetical protein